VEIGGIGGITLHCLDAAEISERVGEVYEESQLKTGRLEV
jgi:hypothetical protein